MKILVTGGTGTVGKEVVQALLRRGASVRVLTRNKEAKLPHGAEVAIGDLLDPDSVGSALNGVDKLFLLVGNVAEEQTQALLTVAVARQAKVKHITYLSVYQAERFPDVPHFIGKYLLNHEIQSRHSGARPFRPGLPAQTPSDWLFDCARTGDEYIHQSPCALSPVRAGRHVG